MLSVLFTAVPGTWRTDEPVVTAEVFVEPIQWNSHKIGHSQGLCRGFALQMQRVILDAICQN